METRANYTLIGLFTIAVIVAGFGFVYWFHRGGGVVDRATYQVLFDGPVSGLRTGAAVLFNGIRVGDVTNLTLDPQNPRQVTATIAINRDAPVRSDTQVAVEYQGLTGIAAVALRGGSQTAPPLGQVNGQPPLLRATPGITQDLMQSGQEVLKRLDTVLSENQESLRNTIKNLETFTDTMARNSERFDRIITSTESVLTGAETLIGGKDGKEGQIQQAVQSFKTLTENLDKRTAETLASVKQLTENLDKRTAELATGLQRFTNTGLREWERFAVDGRRAANEFERAVRNFQRNPSRVIWGGALNQNGEQPARRRR